MLLFRQCNIIRILVPRLWEIRISFTHARGIPVSIVPVPAITVGFTYFSTPFLRETRGFGPTPTPVQNSIPESDYVDHTVCKVDKRTTLKTTD